MSFRLRAWQIGFLAALAILLTLLALTRGPERFIAIATVAGIILAVLNAVIGGRVEGGLLTRARELLADHRWLRVLTIVAVLADVGIGVRMVLQHRQRAKTWVLRGAVLSERSTPVPHAEVAVRFPDASTMKQTTDSRGEFELTVADKERAGRATVAAETPDVAGSAEVDLASPSTVVVRARSTDSPLRIDYYLFGETAVDLILLQRNAEAVKSVFGGTVPLIENEVLATLRRLARKYATNFGLNWFTRATEKKREQVGIDTIEETAFAGSSGESYGGYPLAFGWDPPPALVRSILQAGWSLEYEIDRSPADSLRLRFVRPARRADLDELPNLPLTQFYRAVTRKHFPPGFAFVALANDWIVPGECGGQAEGDYYVRALFKAPRLAVRTAVVENLSDRPVRIGALRGRAIADDALRTPAQHERLLDAASQTETPLMNRALILAPRERIAVPVELVFRNEFGVAEEDLVDDEASAKLERRLRSMKSVDFGGLRVPHSVIARSLETASPPRAREFLWGPAQRIEEIEVDGVWRPMRAPDRDSYVVVYTASGLMEAGSCPYLYVRSRGGAWQLHGVFLYAASSRERERTEHFDIDAFDGTLRVVERDPETSYIDELVVLSGERRCVPRDARLAARDGRYVVLRTGDVLDVAYDCRGGIDPLARHRVVASGYYVPLRHGRK